MPQDGCTLRVAHSGGLVEAIDDQGVRGILAHLPEHPDERMRASSRGSCLVLPSGVAPLVTQVLEPPSVMDVSQVYVGEAYVKGGGAQPFVRAVWFTPQTADRRTGRPPGSNLAGLTRLWRRWRGDSCSLYRDGGGGNGTQPAAGVYTELGFGVMPGVGRSSVGCGQSKSVVPFVRNVSLSTALEEPLGDLMSDVSVVLDQVLPRDVLTHKGEEYGCCPVGLREAYQYPRLRQGAPPLYSHQVVLRSAGCSGTSTEADLSAWRAVSDLHVDPGDGGGRFGCCTVASCQPLSRKGTPPTVREKHLLLHRGIAVFPSRNGGRGVHVRSLIPGWNCALLLRTRDCLHGSVVLDESDIAGFALPHYSVFRTVTYPIRRIESLLCRVGETPQLWEEVKASSDETTRNHLEQRRMH